MKKERDKMKNAKISLKFTLLVVPLLLLSILAVAMFAIQSRSIFKSSKTTFYDEILVSTSSILNADRDFYQAAYSEQKLYISTELTEEDRSALLNDFDENVQQTYDRVTAAIDNVKADTALYSTYKHSTEGVTLKELYESFSANFELWKKSYDNNTKNGDMSTHLAYFSETRNSINLMGELLDEYGEYYSKNYSNQITSKIIKFIIAFCIMTVFVGAFALVLVRYISVNLKYITDVNKRLANGDFSVNVDKKRIAKDELGQLCGATDNVVMRLRGYVDYITEIAEVLSAMARGHMRIDLKQDYFGEFAVIKEGLLGISNALNTALTEIAETAEQVDDGANVISSGAQSLAQGATEQASSIQELSASVAEVSQRIAQNAENAEKAMKLSADAGEIMHDSVSDMELARQAMNEISATSSSISKVIKAIDDIAFQTNILALNAAVEAARAGTAGKGFAVVADEVRNLSQKSAEAAKSTAALIESSMEAVEKGVALVNKTSAGFAEAASKSDEVGKLVEVISAQAQEQAAAISQISTGIEQVSAVVQMNSATSEENAAASAQLSGQAGRLKNAVSQFELY